MGIYSTVISTIATSSGGGTSTFIISNITGVYPVGITNDTDAFTSGGLVFSGSNMTIGTSVDGGTNYIQMTAGIGGMAASAGTELVSSGTMIFSNSNGISFGFNASTLTASHNAFSNTSQLTNYLAPKTHIHGSVSLDLLNMSGATASASDGLTLSLTGPPGVISLNGASGQLTFNEGSFINISQNIRSFTINVSNTSAITSAAFPSANTTKFAGSGTTTVSTAGSDLKLTLNSQGLNLGVPAWLTTAATGGGGGGALQGSGSYTQNSGTIQFANSNSMTFGLTENQMTASFSYTQSTHEHPYLGSGESTYYQTSNLSSIFITTAALSNHSHTQYLTTALETNYTSHTHDYQSTGNYLTTALGTSYTSHTHSQYLTTAMVSQNTSLFVYTSASSLLQHTSATSAITSNALNTSVSGSFQLTANNSLSLDTGYTTHTHNYQSTGDYITTAAQVSHTHGSISTASTAGTAFTYSSASNGLSFSIPNWITTYAADGGEIDISAGASSDRLASIVFSNGSGVSFGLNGSTITASVKTDYQTAGAYLTTALATDYTSHTHSQYLTTAALSSHTHSDLYIAKGDSTAYQTSILSGTFLQTGYTTHTHNYQSAGAYLTTAMLSNMTSVFEYTSHTSAITASALNTSQSSLFQHTSATSAITSNAVNTSVTSAYQLIANSTLSLGTAYTSHTHSNLYIALANSTAYATSVLSNTFQTTGAYLTTAALSNHSHTDYISNFNAGDYISISKVGQSVSISAINLQATSATSAITASAMNTSERNNYFYTSNNTFLTTAAISNHTHSDLYIALANSTYYQSSNLSSVFQTTGAYLTTAMASNAGSNFAGTGLTTASTAGSDLAITYNSVGLNLGIPKWVTTGGAGGGIAIAGSGSTETDSTVIFSASNGITFGLSDYTMTASIANNAGSLGFADSNGVTFGIASTASNSSTVVTASIAAYAGILTTGITGGSATINSSQVQINIPSNAGNIYFEDIAGFSFIISTSGLSTTIKLSTV